MSELLDELPRAGRITFRRLTAEFAERIDVIIRFLAVLELYKQGAVEIDQPERFGDIEIQWCADEGFDSDAVLIVLAVLRLVEVGIEHQAIAETAATASRDPDADERLIAVLLRFHRPFDFLGGSFGQRNRHRSLSKQ